MKGQMAIGIGMIIVIISGVIGFTIIDSISVSTNNLSRVVNESKAVTLPINESQPLVITLNNIPLAQTGDNGLSPVITNQYGNVTFVDTVNYDILSTTVGTINLTDIGTGNGTAVLVTYDYRGAEYFDNPLSRTIMAFVVPLGLLGLLSLVAFVKL